MSRQEEPQETNQELLLKALDVIGQIREEMVFVGGTIVWTHTDYWKEIRTTKDIDVVIEVTGYGPYQSFIDRLRKDGWEHRTFPKDPVIRYTKEGILLDVMSTGDIGIMEESPWFEDGVKNAESFRVGTYTIRRFNFTYLFAAKLQAFLDRGKNDLIESKDIQDIYNLMASSHFPTFLAQLNGHVGAFIQESLISISSFPDFDRYLQGHFSPDDQGFADRIISTLEENLPL